MTNRLPCYGVSSASRRLNDVDNIERLTIWTGHEQALGLSESKNFGQGVPVNVMRCRSAENESMAEAGISLTVIGHFEYFILLVATHSSPSKFKRQLDTGPSLPRDVLLHKHEYERRASKRCGDPRSQNGAIQCFPPLVGGSSWGIRILSAEGLRPVFRANKKPPAGATAEGDETKTNQ